MTCLILVVLTLIVATAVVPVVFGVAFVLIPLFIAVSACLLVLAFCGMEPA